MQEMGNSVSQLEPHDPAENSLFETMVRMEHDLSDVINALAVLGVKRCSECKQFFRSAEPGALFENGHTVCYRCIPGWWSSMSTRLGIADRERIEAKLASWLRKHHRAEVVKESSRQCVRPHECRISNGSAMRRVRWVRKADGGRALSLLQWIWHGTDRGA